MDKKNVGQISRALLAAWNAGVERATDNAARADELVEQQLNDVSGMHIESGLRGGGWHYSGQATCTSCAATCRCVTNAC